MKRPNWTSEFDRTERRIGFAFIAAWIVSAAVSLGLVAVIIWAIFRVVTRYT